MKTKPRTHLLTALPLILSCHWAAASTVYFRVSVDDYALLKINNVVIAQYDAFPWGEAYGLVDLAPGWYPIDLVYKNRWGSTALYFYERLDATDPWEYVLPTQLRSIGADGQEISGLLGTYSLLNGAYLGTRYGEGPIVHGWSNQYNGQPGQWAGGLVDTNWGTFQERLTGEIRIGDVPEPATLMLFAAGLGLLGIGVGRRQGGSCQIAG